MPVTFLRSRLPLIIAVCVVAAAAAESAWPEHKPMLVEVWCGGDDGLTSRLRDALESAFKLSSDFRLSTGKKPETLLVTIPSNVEWKKLGARTRVLYTTQFSSSSGQDLGSSKGSCWEDALGNCASQIVKDARVAARKIH